MTELSERKVTIKRLLQDDGYYFFRFFFRFQWYRKSTKLKWSKVKWWTGRVYWLPFDYYFHVFKNRSAVCELFEFEDWSTPTDSAQPNLPNNEYS